MPDPLKAGLKKRYDYAKWDANYGIWWYLSQKLASHNIKEIDDKNSGSKLK